jgi:DNA-binding protein H-NS
MDISVLSLSELRTLQKAVNEEVKKREIEDSAKAKAQMIAIAKSHGIQLEDLFAQSSRAKLQETTIRYRHPNNPNLQWSGRGRQPNWIKEALSKGEPLSSFLV